MRNAIKKGLNRLFGEEAPTITQAQRAVLWQNCQRRGLYPNQSEAGQNTSRPPSPTPGSN